ncbi:homoserine dehydrogenase [Marine Group I thaumarchaeote]|uniref:homoserine dehydrogenase n=1 Tax=Marine Group I thaumarchaeote TaxID=2511932 RepID=A0A7K4NU49_9ARCH|nr:homoserine dehydrogenase [Marine Group I thaumarchaeote]
MRIILCGFGVVGQSFAKLLESRSEDLYARYGLKPRIVGVFDRNGSAVDPSGLDSSKLIDVKKKYGSVNKYSDTENNISGTEIINNLEAEVLIETTESNYKDAEPGMTHIVDAMKRGMHVISVNKGPLALAFPSLMEIAEYNHVLFRFSGTVGGGTPILDFAKNSLRGERIVSFDGILNGTTNYILTNMANGMSFNDALDDAKQKGYVEADESLDLDGLDAAAKLVILANWIMGMKVTMPDIKRTGIRKIDNSDIKRAADKNCAIKLIASCDKELTVAPKEITSIDPLCVSGTLNAISFTSEHSGTQTIIGRGAGGIETASSILRDLIDIRNESTKT